MEELVKKIEHIVDVMKAMMAAIKQPTVSTNSIRMPKTPKMGMTKPKTGLAPDSKKDPVKVAEQISNPDIKKPAVAAAKESVSYSPKGQWSIK